MKEILTIELLKLAAKEFCMIESEFKNKDLFGVTDGKAVGTFIEHKFQQFLEFRYDYDKGSSAKGIDLPHDDINTDIKVTSFKQPQSSCPFKDAKQKIFGLGYNLLIFVYDKTDDPINGFAILDFLSCTFIEKDRTADFTTTFRLREMLNDGANKEDIIAFLNDKNLPGDEAVKELLADSILSTAPKQGYLTISNALQWRLQYTRVVNLNNPVQGITKIIDKVVK